MLLAIDSGNTNVLFAVFDGEEKKGEWRSARAANRTADEYAVWLMHLMAMDGLKPEDIDAAIVANVVPAASYDLRMLCQRYFGVRPLVVGDPEVELGIEIKVNNPEEVGADRLVNAVGAQERYAVPLIIIDFGTATTFDVVDDTGAYAGGVIAPGINLSLEALHTAAAQLPRVAVSRPEKVIGKGTVSAMQSGIYYGYVGLIEGLVARMKTELKADAKVIATGGLAPLFNEATDVIDELDGGLTLRGLLSIYRRNT